MASVTPAPFSKWDLERFIYSDPALSTTERWVAVQILKTLDNKFRPVMSGLMSQALIGWRLHKWRESVNRAVRKLVLLGYFCKSWVTVDRDTAQGVKGVTRVMCELGPVLRKLTEGRITRPGLSAAQARGGTSHHPSPTPPGAPGTVGDPVVANSADRNGGALENRSEFRAKTLGQWPRLAGRQRPTAQPPPFAELAELERLAMTRDAELGLELFTQISDDELEARRADSRRRQAGLVPGQRIQPRRRPRSQR